ncbi:unnamed protein product [Arctogadus glacialis]
MDRRLGLRGTNQHAAQRMRLCGDPENDLQRSWGAEGPVRRGPGEKAAGDTAQRPCLAVCFISLTTPLNEARKEERETNNK